MPLNASTGAVAHADLPPLKVRLREIMALAVALVAAFLLVNFLHFQTLPVRVVLYACIEDAIVASIIVLGAYWGLRRKTSPLLITELALAAACANLLIAVYSIMGPTVIDRSLSIYIVEKLDSRGGKIALSAMKPIVAKEFMEEYHVADVRLTEQVASHTAVIENGCVKITPRGRLVAAFTHFYRKTFLPKKRDIMGVVGDQLSDPLKNSPMLVPYECPAGS